MFELIILLVVGAILISIIQGARRGEVTPEERKKNPTLIESAAAFTEELAEHAENFRNKTEFDLVYCAWFRHFNSAVSLALELAEKETEHEKELDADPKLREIYNKIEAEWDEDDADAVPQSEPEWIQLPLPSKPRIGSNPEQSVQFGTLYDEHLKRHESFLEDTRKKLGQQPDMRKFFRKNLTNMGLEVLLTEYFPEESNPKNIFELAGVPKSQPKNTTAVSVKESSKKDLEIGTKNKFNVSLKSGGKISTSQLRAFNTTRLLPPEKVRIDQPALQNRNKEIRTLAEKFKIPHLVHFTRCDNLSSILQHGLRSVSGCHLDSIRAIRNDGMRLDGHLDGISLSVTFPNFRMFYKYRQLDTSADWAVLLLKPEVLWELDCGFYRHNAADSRMRHLSTKEMTTVDAFQAMFETSGTPRELWLRACDPTDSQAEVMVFDTIDPCFIETVAFEDKPIAAKWANHVRGIDKIHAGLGKGLFGTRATVRQI